MPALPDTAGALAFEEVRIPGGGADTVLLHGYAMGPADLSPFARSLGLPGRYLFPQGPLQLGDARHAWWPRIQERRRALHPGPRDLALEHPADLPRARQRLADFLRAVRGPQPARSLILGGFSQGAMLALDYALQAPPAAGEDLTALVLLSGSRIALADWSAQLPRLRDLPIFVSHGRRDGDLAFAAGEALVALLTAAAARVTWCPFDGSHEIPLGVWRQLKRFLQALP